VPSNASRMYMSVKLISFSHGKAPKISVGMSEHVALIAAYKRLGY
jgi:hypothetical protein